MEHEPGRRDSVDPSEYDLLGYVLGALDDDERLAIEKAVEQYPELQDALDSVYASLPKSEETWKSHRPPSGLARRTCERVADFQRSLDVLDQLPPKQLSEVSPRPSNDSAWSWKDLALGSAACIAFSLILLPAILNSRHQARILNCQNNLQRVGIALRHYSDAWMSRLPSGSVDSPLGVAGAFGPILKDQAVIEDRHLVCPSTALAQGREFKIPSRSDVEQASGSALSRMQRLMGGTYAFTLGHIEKNVWQPPICRNRPWSIVMADGVDPQNPLAPSQHHGRQGQNVLFEDGHTAFLTDCSPHLLGDDRIYVNRYGEVAAGIDADDTVLGMSFARPVVTPVSYQAK